VRRSALTLLVVLASCRSRTEAHDQPKAAPRTVVEAPDPFARDRAYMVDEHVAARGVDDPRVLEAMRHVPRHELVPDDVRAQAYDDRPLPIGFDKTISQPYIVAVMTAAAKLRAGDKVLEIGTGSGYQAAVLAELGNEVYTLEIDPRLAERAGRDLVRIGYDDVHVRAGDGWDGWADAGPFDAIIVTAAAHRFPAKLFAQLVEGGRMVIPLGEIDQNLMVYTRTADGPVAQELFAVRFGPLLGGPM